MHQFLEAQLAVIHAIAALKNHPPTKPHIVFLVSQVAGLHEKRNVLAHVVRQALHHLQKAEPTSGACHLCVHLRNATDQRALSFAPSHCQQYSQGTCIRLSTKINAVSIKEKHLLLVFVEPKATPLLFLLPQLLRTRPYCTLHNTGPRSISTFGTKTRHRTVQIAGLAY